MERILLRESVKKQHPVFFFDQRQFSKRFLLKCTSALASPWIIHWNRILVNNSVRSSSGLQQRPQRGRSPVEHRGTFICLFVCLFVCASIRPSLIKPQITLLDLKLALSGPKSTFSGLRPLRASNLPSKALNQDLRP